MAKRKQPRRSPQPRFGDALQNMRAATHTGVRSAIDNALRGMPPPDGRRRQRPAAGDIAHALFDGLVLAVAEEVVRASRPGSATDMAELIADAIVIRVEHLTAAGRC